MTTKDWIDKQFGVAGLDKKFASVIRDAKGNIYSYGYHYPLLFKIDGINFRNTAGYSSTTGKHIGWAGGHNTIDVNLPRNFRLNGGVTLHHMAEFLALEKAEKVYEMSEKKRKNTHVYQWLQRELDNINQNLSRLNIARG